ncbi:Enhancer of polycomb-like protein [Lachnellula suecica]|uniref:Enhancer of polycomb-like protein n=1 Tax=Lachnellula suecica TaxID=602035 RepID=A0A8T9C8U0_9HELO|nr:Enhancer of polycomb-like protein [Lachnellula suecica]
MAPQGRLVRTRKITPKTVQPVLREDQIEIDDFNSLQNAYKVETGVEGKEENEYHLQAALKSTTAGDKETEEIPAPPAVESTDINYDALYKKTFVKPVTYIRVSETVEDCIGCRYDIDGEDELWLQSFNQGKSANQKCSDDVFERIMDSFEETAAEQAPYASVDNTSIPFETLSATIKLMHPKWLLFAAEIYEHWKARRLASGNGSIQPSLKFETHQEKDDADPYVCFRRREMRQTRKTRARDVQSTDKLKKLRLELENARQLVKLAHQRETQKQDTLRCDKNVFEQRFKVKVAKNKLGIKGDDDDFINQKPQKRKSEMPQLPRGTPQMRLPARSDGRPLEADLILLSDVLAQKEIALQKEIDEKTQQHRKWNQGHVDLTRDPLSPVNGQGLETGFRPATAQYQYLMTPPSSVTSESFDQPSPAQDKQLENFAFRYSPPPEEEEHRGQPAYRRRIGRGGRLWIDRRGMCGAVKNVDENMSDRWKYDQDDDEEQPVYEVDPYDTKSLRFRATIPFPPHFFPQHSQQQGRPRPIGPNPANRAIAQVPQPAAPP